MTEEASNDGRMATAPSAFFAGPSTSPGGSPSGAAIASNTASMSRAEHYDVVLEGGQGEQRGWQSGLAVHTS